MTAAPAYPESRHVAKWLTFEPQMVPYINWQALGDQRRELACDMDVTRQPDGGLHVMLFWDNSDGKMRHG